MSGVKGLAAMFEQKGENSPPQGNGQPDRGRSPGLSSFGIPTPSQSPRPLPKVRTSFIAVEKDGRVGLKRDHSGDSVSVSSRRLSNETETTTPSTTLDKTEAIIEVAGTTVTTSLKTNISKEPIPESPRQEVKEARPSYKIQSEGKVQTPNESEIRTKSPVPSATNGVRARQAVASVEDKTNNNTAKSSTPTTTSSLSSSLLAAAAAAPPPPLATAIPAKPSTTTTSAAAGLNASVRSYSNRTKSPLAQTKIIEPAPTHGKTSSRINGNGNTSGHGHVKPIKKQSVIPKDQKEPKVEREKSHKTVLSRQSVPKHREAENSLPSHTGSNNPRSKSPTRPIKLPASLVTHTAASASKLGPNAHPARQTHSRAGGHNNRPQSRSSVATTSGAKTLRRQSSSINRPRPSLGPPPKQSAKDYPPARREKEIDESFLARMMRPTQSSSYKTTEKVPLTPPKKTSSPLSAKKTGNKSSDESLRKAITRVDFSGKSRSYQPGGKEKDPEEELEKEKAETKGQERETKDVETGTTSEQASSGSGGDSTRSANPKSISRISQIVQTSNKDKSNLAHENTGADGTNTAIASKLEEEEPKQMPVTQPCFPQSSEAGRCNTIPFPTDKEACSADNTRGASPPLPDESQPDTAPKTTIYSVEAGSSSTPIPVSDSTNPSDNQVDTPDAPDFTDPLPESF